MSSAVLLFSGGLDSILAYKVLKDAGVEEVLAVFFETPFFKSEKASEFARANGINLMVEDVFEEYKSILLNPRYGYGKCMNPCIDCHAFMMMNAAGLAEERGADFISTGEVLGQRPMSQNGSAFLKIRKLTGLEIVRPLSAKLLPETEAEKRGLVNREKLLSISGRSRKEQMEAAERFGIKTYPSPSGGCLLTEIEYSKKLRAVIERNLLEREVLKAIRYGRIVTYKNGIGVIGRDEADNGGILSIKGRKEAYQVASRKGPVGILFGTIEEEEKNDFMKRLADYSKKSETREIIVL